jgi:threonine/homoserine/homoserine lactone efflux protein
MFEIQNYFSFITTIFLFQLFPGVGTITILNATAKSGSRGGMSAVLGTLLGDFVYMLSAVLGLATILNAYPEILGATQWVGAIYLCWIGLKFLRVSGSFQSSAVVSEKGTWSFFIQALAVSLTNPKAIMFFMAFFPLFLRADSSSTTLLVMVLHVTIISLCYQTCLVLVGKAIAKYISKWKYSKIIAIRLAGICLIGFGIKLANSIK